MQDCGRNTSGLLAIYRFYIIDKPPCYNFLRTYGTRLDYAKCISESRICKIKKPSANIASFSLKPEDVRRTLFPRCKSLATVIRSSSWTKMSCSRANIKQFEECMDVALPHKTVQEGQVDHRKIGCDQELFFFHPLSPGSAFWYPKGAHIYNKLMAFLRKEYRKRGFTEVITPNLYNCKLWQMSGHWDQYSDNMYQFKIDDELIGLKPMNCPGHCLMYSHEPRTHKELPLRFADFGVLHRNEPSGAITGLTRVRRFQQDDAHIFCRRDQIREEIRGCLDFLSYCYEKVFSFTFELNLSTRPQKFLGEIATWNEAEMTLKETLEGCGKPWQLKEGDGAFYGPKIDITIKDSLGRSHQCATIQLDFQLPQRFDLSYLSENGEKKRPVVIHRAILGSFERMIAVLAENCAGKWPFWLSPRQAKVVAVDNSVGSYALEVKQRLYAEGFEVEYEEHCSDTFNKQIRKAIQAQFNFILVVGASEVKNGTVNVRSRENKRFGEVPLEKLISAFRRFDGDYVKDVEMLSLGSRLPTSSVH